MSDKIFFCNLSTPLKIGIILSYIIGIIFLVDAILIGSSIINGGL